MFLKNIGVGTRALVILLGMILFEALVVIIASFAYQTIPVMCAVLILIAAVAAFTFLLFLLEKERKKYVITYVILGTAFIIWISIMDTTFGFAAVFLGLLLPIILVAI